MIDTETMTMSEIFGTVVASRGVTSNSSMLEVMTALVDTTREASKEVADLAETLITFFVDGNGGEFLDVLSDFEGEFISNRTGEVVSVPLLP